MTTLPLLAMVALTIVLHLADAAGSAQQLRAGSNTTMLGAGIGEERHSGGPVNASYDRGPEARIAACTRRGTGELDVSLTIRDAPNQVKVGSDLTYRARVTNCSATTAGLGITLQNAFSSPVALQTNASSLGCYSPEPQTVLCDLATVAPGETRRVHFVVRPATAGILIDTAEVFHGPDPTPENNRVVVTTRVR